MQRIHLAAALCAASVLLCVRFAAAQPIPSTGVFTWEPVGDRTLDVSALDFTSDGVLIAGTTDSIYALALAPDGPPTGQWQALPGRPRLGIRAVLALGLSGDTLLVSRSNTIMARSLNGGATWTDVNGCSSGCPTGGPESPGGFLALPSGRILAGGPLIRSDDRGATWATVPGLSRAVETLAFARLPSGRVISVGYGGVLTSDDDGGSFAAVPRFQNLLTQGVTALATPGSRQAAGATGEAPACGLPDASRCDGAVVVVVDVRRPTIEAFWTNDGGRSWSAPSPMPQPEDGIGLSIVAGVVNVGVGLDGLGHAVAVLGRGVYYTTADGGQSWALAGRLPIDGQGIDFAEYPVLGPDGHLWVMMSVAGPGRVPLYRSVEPASVAFPVASEAPPAEASGIGVSVRPNPSRGRVAVRRDRARGAARARRRPRRPRPRGGGRVRGRRVRRALGAARHVGVAPRRVRRPRLGRRAGRDGAARGRAVEPRTNGARGPRQTPRAARSDRTGRLA